MRDFMGVDIEVGDTVVYPVRSGSSLYVRKAVVLKVVEPAADGTRAGRLGSLRLQPPAENKKRYTKASGYKELEDYVETYRPVTLHKGTLRAVVVKKRA